MILLVVALLVGGTAHAASAASSTYSGFLPGSFWWNIGNFFGGLNEMLQFTRDSKADVLEQHIQQRAAEISQINNIINSWTTPTGYTITELEAAKITAQSSQEQDLYNLAQIGGEGPAAKYVSAVDQVVTGLSDSSLASAETALQNNIKQDQGNGNASALLLAQTNLDAIEQIAKQEDASYLSKQEALQLAAEQEAAQVAAQQTAKDAQALAAANYWTGAFKNTEQNIAKDYQQRGVAPNLIVAGIGQEVDGLLAQAHQDVQAGDPDKANMLWAQTRQLLAAMQLEAGKQFVSNDAVPEAAGNQTPQQVNQGQVKQPVAQPKPVLQTIPSESVATSPLQLLGDTELDGTVNQPFDTTYDAEGGLPPYHFQLGTGVGFPPHGIVLDTNGELSGTPTTDGTATFNVCAVDTAGKDACEDVTMTVEAAQVATPEFCPPCKEQYDACWQACDDTYHACNDAVPIGAVNGEEMQSACWDTLGSCDNTCSQQQNACLQTASPSCTNEPWQ